MAISSLFKPKYFATKKARRKYNFHLIIYNQTYKRKKKRTPNKHKDKDKHNNNNNNNINNI